MEIEVKGNEKGYIIISVTLINIALIIKSFEHEEFVVLLFALIGGSSLKDCALGRRLCRFLLEE